MLKIPAVSGSDPHIILNIFQFLVNVITAVTAGKS